MADHDDPERQRRLEAFWRWEAEHRGIRHHGEAFVAGCEHEASLLSDLLERMAAAPRHELGLLREIAAVVDGWTGTPEEMREASLVFAKAAMYVKLLDMDPDPDGEPEGLDS